MMPPSSTSREQIEFTRRISQALAASGSTSITDPKLSRYLDQQDPFRPFRNEFSIPTKATVAGRDQWRGTTEEGERPAVYLAGNSLGLMPKRTPHLIQQELEVWATSGVLGHVDHEFDRPWVKIDETVTPILAQLVGAKHSEVACMGTLTGNLNTLLTSFYRPTPKRHKILFEGKAFPSDAYAFASHISLHDFPSTSLLPVHPRPGEHSLRTEDILEVIEREGEEISVICFGAVQYYNGEWFDMKRITEKGHEKGCLVSFDLAHAIGNVPLELHDWGIDFACWCSYKYLNSGPGGIAGLYVHERWEGRKRLAGWWGHDKKTRFSMPIEYSPLPGAAGWQQSNPSVLSVVSLLSSLEIFDQAARILSRGEQGGQIGPSRGRNLMGGLRDKSLELTGLLEVGLKASRFWRDPEEILPPDQQSPQTTTARDDGEEERRKKRRTKYGFTIITPSDPSRRGCQLSLLFDPVSSMDEIFARLRTKGVLGDERRPGVIRFGPTPMYNTFEDVNEATRCLEEILEELEREG